MLNEISSLKFRDLEIFEEVARSHSIREVARRRNTSSGQISKIVQNIESLVGTKLFKRSVSGVFLTAQGAELRELATEILDHGARIEKLLSRDNKSKTSRVLAIGGTSFLNTHFITPIVCKFASLQPTYRFRFLDMTPDQLVNVGLRGGFEIAVHFGQVAWPSTWTSKKLGHSRWILCCRADHSLPKRPSLKQILDQQFVVPTYWTTEGLAYGNDQFQIALSKRKQGFETATAEAAVPIVMNTDQLAFLPQVLVRHFILSKQLREIRSDELQAVERDVYISAKADVVPAALFENLSHLMSEHLAGHDRKR